MKIAEHKRKPTFSCLARAQPMISAGLLVYYCPLNFLFLSVKEFPPFFAEDLNMVNLVTDPEL